MVDNPAGSQEGNLPEPSISAYLTVDGAEEAVAYYEKVFGMTCTFRMPAEDGKRLMHATLRRGNSVLMMSDIFPEFSPHPAPDKEAGSPVAISLLLDSPEDVDKMYDLALEEGGLSSWPPENMFWGDRFCQLYDPFGHRWMLVARLPADRP